jgi:hypothetical protein
MAVQSTDNNCDGKGKPQATIINKGQRQRQL